MKELLLGNAAVARGAWEAGVCLASSYPGTPSTEITAAIAKYDEIYTEWAPNEKVGMEVAWGACLAGKRSFTGMKHVGLNVAADTLFTISYTGVNAGMVIAVADEPGMHSSQNEQDSRHYARAAKVPMLEPADSAECLEFTKLAYELSEKYDTPIIVRLCTRISHSQSVVKTEEREKRPVKEYVKNPQKYVMMPTFARPRHPIVEKRMSDLRALSEKTELNRIELGGTDLGIITSGTCYQYVKEVFGEKASVLKLGFVHPLPEDLIIDFSKKVKRLVVVEELDPFIEDHCKKLGLDVTGKDMFSLIGELSPNIIAEKFGVLSSKGKTIEEDIPNRPPVMCAGCSHRGLFYVLSKLKAMVHGDIGCYTLGATPPLNSMDTCVCMGASISGLHGFVRAGGKNAVCVIGDSTFAHMGINGLIDIGYNQSDSTVIIADNSITGMTGHQENPTTGFNIRGEKVGKMDIEMMCKACGIERIRTIDPNDLAESERVIKQEMNTPGASVIIAKRPCMLLKSSKPAPALNVDEGKCTGCTMCMKIGCPAISMRDKKASVNHTLCVGCNVCTQLCKFDAFDVKRGLKYGDS
ncbi:MAG: indolepyruvate ferredoxin oxidoreductase subunit alpha [Oscillospiraceae bacterium]|nr:indolepyruvate ferredoxin oxidoreductase subunit alpha [Oscillospiraceae bacterium]MCL2278922.1 indolepyruvate ferredoxin oxidoreductase subunit alpha [Oscillospiraceae bacterium]